MAKRTAYLHIGLPHSSGPLYTAALTTHADALATQGLGQPAGSDDELFRAAVELRRDHTDWGLRRKHVEGTWAEIGRRAYRARTDVVISHDLLAGCTADEVALLLDGLVGLKVRVILTASAPDTRVPYFPGDHDLATVAERWTAHLRSQDRLHVVVTDPADPQPGWEALGRIIGFDAAALPLPDLTTLVPAGAEPRNDAPEDRLTALTTALTDSIAELTRLRSANETLVARNAELERKKAKLKGRLAGAGRDR